MTSVTRETSLRPKPPSLGLLALAPLPLILADRLYRSIRHTTGFGEGDIWLLAALGLWTGPWGGVIIFVIAAWLGVGVAAYL